MMIKASTYLQLLGTALLAAGCTTYGEFTEENTRLQCEIDVACGSEPRNCEQEAYPYEKDECTKYHRVKANRCLEELEEQLALVEEEPSACEGLQDPEVCGDATSSHKRDGCGIVEGRPLRHDGQLVLAEVARGSAWSDAPADRAELQAEPRPALRQRAAARWLEIARQEHASVAAFARVSLELMAVGAPPHLLEGCHRAALDEVGHARLALDLARALGGEGSAAACAHISAERACGPAAAAVRTIAAEETRHAALAWSTLQWALQRDPALAEPLARAFEDALVQRRERARIASPREASLAAHGLLGNDATAAIELDVAERIVAPVLARLLLATRANAEARAGLA
jgi:hypothetical protein